MKGGKIVTQDLFEILRMVLNDEASLKMLFPAHSQWSEIKTFQLLS